MSLRGFASAMLCASALALGCGEHGGSSTPTAPTTSLPSTLFDYHEPSPEPDPMPAPEPTPEPSPEPTPGPILLHTEKVLLVDGEGRLRGVYNGVVPFDIDRLIEDIGTLRRLS